MTVDAAGTTATISLPTLTPGTYTVSYQVTSAVDGHVGSGIFAFGIDPDRDRAAAERHQHVHLALLRGSMSSRRDGWRWPRRCRWRGS